MQPPTAFTHLVTTSLQRLSTGYFAAVMATGIVSIALLLTGHSVLSRWLFGIAVVLYALLIVLYIARLVRFRREVWADMTNASKVFGYFTFIAGTDVVGTRYALAGVTHTAIWLAAVGLISWTLLMYFILIFLLFYNVQPVEKVINGSWLITTVSIESLTVIGSALASLLPQYQLWLMFFSFAFWALGVIIYVIFIGIIMYRFFFYPIRSQDLSPPYWINMGAMAITTLAGSRLVLYPHGVHFLNFVEPFVEGITVALWVWGTWWIPTLLLIGIWKYFVFRERVEYDPALWSIIFPLGMYTAACDMMSRIPGLTLIAGMVTPCLWIAVTAWSVVCVMFFIKQFLALRAIR